MYNKIIHFCLVIGIVLSIVGCESNSGLQEQNKDWSSFF